MSENNAGQARRVVITAAGLGTRFLPVTKTVPKELLPIVDTPAMQYIMEEAVDAGLDRVLVITSRGKETIADYFDRSPELEQSLEDKGEMDRLASIRQLADLATVHFVRQGMPHGLGHAVLRAESFVGNESFALMLGDDIIDSRDPLLSTMLAAQAKLGGCILALLEVPPESVSLYGCVATDGIPDTDGLVRVTDLVEKPRMGRAPSNLAVIGRYVLPPEIFEQLRRTEPGYAGELQLTDAIKAMALSGQPVHGVVFRGGRYDTGDRLGYLQAVVQLACERPDVGTDFRQWLGDFLAGKG